MSHKPTGRPPGRPRNPVIDPSKMLELARIGANDADIAKELGLPLSAVKSWLRANQQAVRQVSAGSISDILRSAYEKALAGNMAAASFLIDRLDLRCGRSRRGRGRPKGS
jgi:hypothetical protein